MKQTKITLLTLLVMLFLFSCSDDQELVPNENIALSSNGKPVKDKDLSFGLISTNDMRQITGKIHGSHDHDQDNKFYLSTAYSPEYSRDVVVFSPNGSTDWVALNPDRTSGVNGYLFQKGANFVGMLDYPLPGMEQLPNGKSLLFEKDGAVYAKLFRVDFGEILKTRKDCQTKGYCPIRMYDFNDIACNDDIRVGIYASTAVPETWGEDIKASNLEGTDAIQLTNSTYEDVTFFIDYKTSGFNMYDKEVTVPARSITRVKGAVGGTFVISNNKTDKINQGTVNDCGDDIQFEDIKCNDDINVGTYASKDFGYSNGDIKASAMPKNAGDIIQLTNATSETVTFFIDYEKNYDVYDIEVEVLPGHVTRVKGAVGGTFVISNNKTDKINQGTVNDCGDDIQFEDIKCNDDINVGTYASKDFGYSNGDIKASAMPKNAGDIIQLTNATSETVTFFIDYEKNYDVYDIEVEVLPGHVTRVKGAVGGTFVISNNKTDKINQGTVNDCGEEDDNEECTPLVDLLLSDEVVSIPGTNSSGNFEIANVGTISGGVPVIRLINGQSENQEVTVKPSGAPGHTFNVAKGAEVYFTSVPADSYTLNGAGGFKFAFPNNSIFVTEICVKVEGE